MYTKLIIAGHLGNDPEMRYTPGGSAVTNFSVAANRSWKASDGSKGEETIWFRVAAWGRMAEVCNEYLHKGRPVLVEGRLNPDSETGGPRVWTGRDGQPRASYEVTASTVKFLSSGNGRSTAPAQEEEDEIPF
jgi:single-strand DNA-binding protein